MRWQAPKNSIGNLSVASSLAVVLSVALIVGCKDLASSRPSATQLPAITVPQDAIQLDVVFVERLREDPLWTKELWDGLDQISTLSIEQRQRIDADGMIVGVSGSTPAPPLQRLLELKTEMPDQATTTRERSVNWSTVYRRSGDSLVLDVSPTYPELDVSEFLPERDKPLKDAEIKLEVKIERLQDGWVKLHVTPQIHHGHQMALPIATEHGFELKAQRQIETLVNRKFSLSLNIGEMMVVTEDPSAQGQSWGRLLFEAPGPSGVMQRLVLIRLTDMKKADLY